MLVTGAMGFMGSAFVRHLLQSNTQIRQLINLDALTYAANEENLSSVDRDPRYHFVQGSVCDANLLERLYAEFQFDQIVHFAAETHVDRSISDANPFIETNILGSYTLLEFIKNHPKVHLHIISTDEVYGSIRAGKFTEKSPFKPNSPYSASKASADHLARAYHKTYDLHVTISHASNNFGPCQYPEKMIPVMLKKMMQKEPLPIYGDGQHIRDWLYVEDHARGVEAIINNAPSGSVYNLGAENEWRNIDLVHLLIEEYASITQEDPDELRSLITFVQDRPGHDLRYAVSNTKIKQELNWSPQVSMQEGIQNTIRWYINDAQKQKSHMCYSS